MSDNETKTIIINKTILKTRNVLKDFESAIFKEDFWHKFIIKDVRQYDRNSIMKGFTESVYPAEILPVKYKKDVFGSAEFLGKCCGEVIQKLIENKLQISILHQGVKQEFQVDIILRYCPTNKIQVDLQDVFCKILNKRFNRDTEFLNLENFVSDPELVEYCPLSQPKLLNFILYLSAQFNPKSISLAKNDIKVLPKDICWEQLTTLEKLDLHDNELPCITQIEDVQVPLKSLNLDGNPLCEGFVDSLSYIQVIKSKFPTLTELDGQNISSTLCFAQDNFLCSGYGYEFVNEFLQTYFKIYDSNRRHLLANLYNPTIYMSLTLTVRNVTEIQSSSHFREHKRNRDTSLSKRSTEALVRNKLDLFKLFLKLPLTEHDYSSFKVDLLLFTDSLISLVVTGVFRENSEDLLKKPAYYTFSRHFILSGKNFQDFSIVNELLHISTMNRDVTQKNFVQAVKVKPDLLPKNEQEETLTIKVMSELTGLNKFWSKRYLHKEKFNLSNALKAFSSDADKIPQNAFEDPDIAKNTVTLSLPDVKADWINCKNSVSGNNKIVMPIEISEVINPSNQVTNIAQNEASKVLSNVVPINHKLMFEKAKPINVPKKVVIPAAQNLQADQASEVSSTTPDFIKMFQNPNLQVVGNSKKQKKSKKKKNKQLQNIRFDRKTELKRVDVKKVN
ncbi:nuclear RNA export factor 2 [Aethina tumida]|uniref:nuclear RNA export factor 2 n=1 Tax=Aethina tumida TaxID=116153 RepID=UPI00096B10B7|nr:nuclear RNA export factor 2 [Aethina tumida]